jgi:hypothetical protein
MKMMKFVQQNPSRCKMKEDGTKLSVSIQRVSSVDDANELLRKILE